MVGELTRKLFAVDSGITDEKMLPHVRASPYELDVRPVRVSGTSCQLVLTLGWDKNWLGAKRLLHKAGALPHPSLPDGDRVG